MKRTLFSISLALVASLLLSGMNQAFGQCVTCTPNESLLTPISNYPEGGLAPNPAPPVTQGSPYETAMTFLMPTVYDAGSPIGNVDITQVVISSIDGLPSGISWNCNIGNCTYQPQSYQFGCVQFCGTTYSAPGIYPIEVTVLGTAMGVTQPLTMETQVEVLPATGGNTGFEFSPTFGCDQVTSSFHALIDADPNPTTYAWTFANGNTDTGEYPADQTFTTPGVNQVTLVTTIWDYVLESVSAQTVSDEWCGDAIGELWLPWPINACNGDPDLKFNVSDGSGQSVATGGEVGDTQTPSWPNVNAALNAGDGPFAFQFIDVDGDADDDLGGFAFNLTAPGTFYANGAHVNVTYTIGLVAQNTITNVDTVMVYASPDDATIVNGGADAFCIGDSTLLTAQAGAGLAYQWYNDTVTIVGSTTDQLWVNAAGNYRVDVYDTISGCEASSNSYSIAVEAYPPLPAIGFNPLTTELEMNGSSGYDIQWYLDGTAINGETGITLGNLVESGPYTVELSSPLGCATVSFPFSLCLTGTVETLPDDTICCGQSIELIADGFTLNNANTIAWAITPEAEGPITSQVEATAAQDNGYLLSPLGDTVTFSRNCYSLDDSLLVGDYYVTPFSIENPSVTPFTWDTLEGCAPNGQMCPSLVGEDSTWSIQPMIFTFPDGSQLNVNDALAFGLPLNQQLLDLAGGLPCLDLTTLFAGDPNGVWSVSVTNVGSVAIDLSFPDFVVINYADSCNLITEDEMYTIQGLDVTAAAGETVSATFNLPPLPGGFPSVDENCAAFGDPVLIHYMDCYPELTNTLEVSGTSVNSTIVQGNGYIDATITGGFPLYDILWDDGITTTEDRFNLTPGTYTVTVTDATNFQVTETWTITGPYLGVEDDLSIYGFSLGNNVPNPSNGNTVISFNSLEQADYNFIVSDASGREVARMNVSGSIGENRIIFDGTSLSSGLYTYSLSNGVSVLTQRMVINK